MANLTNYDSDYIFSRFGKTIRGDRIALKHTIGWEDEVIELEDEIIALLTLGKPDQTILKDFKAATDSVKSSINNARSRYRTATTSFLQKVVGPQLSESGRSLSGIITRLRSEMEVAGDFVAPGLIAHTEPVFDQANGGDGGLTWDPTTPVDQSARHANFIVCTCISEGTDGGVFSISSTFGSIGTATVGEVFDATFGNADGNVAFGVKFTITDGATEDWIIGDQIFISTWWYPEITVLNDGASQLSNIEVDRLDPFRDTNDTTGEIFLELTQDSSGDILLEAFKDLGTEGSIKLASGTRTGDGEIYAAPVGNFGVGIRADVAYTGDDVTISLVFADDYSLFQFYTVNVIAVNVPLISTGSTQILESLAQ